jgi:hypothetical protein
MWFVPYFSERPEMHSQRRRWEREIYPFFNRRTLRCQEDIPNEDIGNENNIF